MSRQAEWNMTTGDSRLTDAVAELLRSDVAIPEAMRARLVDASGPPGAAESGAEPKGVVVIVVNPDGAVVAQHGEFGRHGYGGHTLREAQAMRARMVMRQAFAKKHLNEWMAKKVDEYFAEVFFESAEKAGYRMELVYIGYPEDRERIVPAL